MRPSLNGEGQTAKPSGWGNHDQVLSLTPCSPPVCSLRSIHPPHKGEGDFRYFRTQPPPAGL